MTKNWQLTREGTLEYLEFHRKIDFYELNCAFNEFRISRILLRPINRAGLLVEAACIKPIITSYSRHEGAK